MFIGFLFASPYVNFGDEKCQATNQTDSSITCQTNENQDCLIPFTYKNQVFYGCSKDSNNKIGFTTNKNVRTNKAWCAIDDNSFGICKDNCPGGKFKIHK